MSERYASNWAKQALAIVLASLTVWLLASPSVAWGQSPTAGGGSNAYPQGDFGAQLAAATGDSPDACEWHWGCGGSPFRTGPGRCDTWKVGPRWRTTFDGLALFRDGANIDALAGAATAGGSAIPLDTATVTGDFDHGAGARVTVASHFPQCQGYEMVVGYVGVFGWDAGAFNPDVPPAGAIGALPDTRTQRSLSYHSQLHSLEVNGQSTGSDRLKLFGGIRYVRLDEDIDDISDEYSPTPALSGVATADLELTDIFRNVSVDNNLIGFQGGLRSDLFSLGERFYLSGLANAGAYCNLIQRSTSYRQVDTFSRADDPSTVADESFSVTASTENGYKNDRARVAFVGEVALNALYQINACSTARVGYQVLYLDGVELGNEAFLGLDPTGSDLLLHGWFAGFEYRR
ncbi:MAG: BBP7 family outer membrane beta-barrel protein [Planctomycetota bacterium]